MLWRLSSQGNTMELHNRIDDTKFQERLKEIKAKGRDLQPALEVCAEIVVSSVEKNFDVQGRFSEPGSWRGGSNKWPQSAAAKARGGMTLSDSGQLRASIQSQVSNDQAEVGTNKAYAARRNFGFDGSVTVKSYTRQTKSGKTVTVREHKRNIHDPAYPFMVVQDEDVEEMLDVTTDHLLQP